MSSAAKGFGLIWHCAAKLRRVGKADLRQRCSVTPPPYGVRLSLGIPPTRSSKTTVAHRFSSVIATDGARRTHNNVSSQ